MTSISGSTRLPSTSRSSADPSPDSGRSTCVGSGDLAVLVKEESDPVGPQVESDSLHSVRYHLGLEPVISCATDGLITVKADEGHGEGVALGLTRNGAGLRTGAVFSRTHQPIMSLPGGAMCGCLEPQPLVRHDRQTCMVNEVASIERRWVVVLMAVGLMISFTACGGETSIAASPSDEAAGDPSMSMTASPPDEDAPTYAGCQDLSKVFDSRDENQLSYLPEEHWLIVSPSRGVYKIDLVNDTRCIETNPALAKL
jgi:hypothetical protein